MKLNELIRRGVINKNKIFYKHLKDAVEIYFDRNHQYDREVIEFFNKIWEGNELPILFEDQETLGRGPTVAAVL